MNTVQCNLLRRLGWRLRREREGRRFGHLATEAEGPTSDDR
jgi:hypothetical protein